MKNKRTSDTALPFPIPDKARHPLQKWEPEPLPATKTNGFLEATLKNLKFWENTQTVNKVPYTNYLLRPQFGYSVRGESTDAWELRSFHLFDPLGNEYDSNRIPCVQQDAYRIRILVFRNNSAAFSGDETIATDAIRLPEADNIRSVNKPYSLASHRIRVLWASGSGNVVTNNVPLSPKERAGMNVSGTYDSGSRGNLEYKIEQEVVPSGLDVTVSSDMPHIAFQCPELPEDYRCNVRILDWKGAILPAMEVLYTRGIQYVFLTSTNPPPAISLEFLIHQGKSFEFLVGPPERIQRE